MTDFLSSQERSRRMVAICSKDTVPEVTLRRELHRLGLRFHLHAKNLPGRPDIVLPRYRVVVFVHGCFWHRHLGCKVASTPKSNTDFWLDKFARNVNRDKEHCMALHRLGWRVFVVWECQLNTKLRAAEAACSLAEIIRFNPEEMKGDFETAHASKISTR